MSTPRLAGRRGMTIIEVLFAIVILSGVMLSLSRFGQGFARASRNAAYLTIASDLATGRLEAARAHVDYTTLVSTFHNTVENSATVGANPSMAGYDGYSRSTKAVATVTDSTSYVTVTVTVTSPDISTPVSKTVIIGAR